MTRNIQATDVRDLHSYLANNDIEANIQLLEQLKSELSCLAKFTAKGLTAAEINEEYM